ncbi:IS4 family transposase, partial [Pseudomonas syringae pv. tagetis]
QHAAPLRPKKVQMISLEVWGLLMASHIIPREASQAAVAFGRAPSDIPFKPACQYIAEQLIVMAAPNQVSATGRRL